MKADDIDIDFNTKIFVNWLKPALERINRRNFTYDEMKRILTDIHNVLKNNDLGKEFYNWLIVPEDRVKLIDFEDMTINNDQALREKTAKLWAELNNAPVLPEHINCEGCRVDGMKTIYCDSLCAVRQCAVQKGVTTCGDCQGFETCRMVGTILADAPDALSNLRMASEETGYEQQ